MGELVLLLDLGGVVFSSQGESNDIIDWTVISILNRKYGYDLNVGKAKLNIFLDEYNSITDQSLSDRQFLITLHQTLDYNHQLVESLSPFGDIVIVSDNYKENIDYLSAQFQFQDWANEEVYSFDLGLLKSDRHFFPQLIDQLRISADRLVLIDDSIEKLESAARTGIQGILYKNNQQTMAELRDVTMDAILVRDYGDPNNLYLGKCKRPAIASEEILVEVKASALNRADTLQRKGMYPPPQGASDLLGLEMAGVVSQIGDAVTKWKVGDRVFGLLAGGGYARYASIHQDITMPIPDNFSFEEAAAIPEVFLTAFQALHYLADLQEGEDILIHAGASGVGTAAIQLAKNMGASKIICTASAGKHQLCYDLGASHVIDYKDVDFGPEVKRLTEDQGVDVIIDFLAAPYFQRNIDSLRLDGRMVMLALMGGIKVDQINLVNILKKRLNIMGSTLRARSLDYKIKLTQDFSDYTMVELTTGQILPVIDSTYSWHDVANAHRYMEANMNKGKIILKMDNIKVPD